MGLCTLIILYIVTLHSILYSMGLAGVRDFDTQKFFEEKQPLCVVYFDVDYSMNPKGKVIQYLFCISSSAILVYEITTTVS